MVASIDRVGLEAGDVVAVLAPPSAAGVALFHALLSRSIVLLPLDGRLVERERIEALRESGVHTLVVADADIEIGEKLAAAATERIRERLGAWEQAGNAGHVGTLIAGTSCVEALRLLAEELL